MTDIGMVNQPKTRINLIRLISPSADAVEIGRQHIKCLRPDSDSH